MESAKRKREKKKSRCFLDGRPNRQRVGIAFFFILLFYFFSLSDDRSSKLSPSFLAPRFARARVSLFLSPMSTAVTTRPVQQQAPPAAAAAPAPTAGPKRAGVLLARAVAAVLPSTSSTSVAAPWAKDDILDALYWIRQVLALVAGPLAGLTGRQGVSTFALFVTSACSAGLSWARALGVDEEDLGGMAPLLGEGLSQSVALFVLLWVVTFSATGGGLV